MPTNEIDIYDDIGGEGMDAGTFKQMLKALGDVSEVVINMHSYGGNVVEGFAIAEIIKQHPARFVCNILGAAMSMGSVIPMFCDEVTIAPNAMMMIHDSRGGNESMQADDMDRQAEMLRHLNEQMALAYQQKSQQPIETIRNMMKAETILTPEKAVKLGFANRISDKAFAISATAKLLTTKPKGATKVTTETKTPATVKELKAAFPKASAEFLVKAAEEEMTLEEASKAHFRAMEKENENMKAELEMFKKKDEEAKAKAMEEEEEETKKEEEAKAAAEAKAKRGGQPIAHATGGAGGGLSATARWNDEVNKAIAGGLPKAKALSRVNRQFPELRAAYLAEFNNR